MVGPIGACALILLQYSSIEKIVNTMEITERMGLSKSENNNICFRKQKAYHE
jgi:hypothetical protein